MIARIKNFYCQTEASFRQTQVIEHFTVNLARNVSIMLDNVGIHSQTIFSTLLAMDNVHYRLILIHRNPDEKSEIPGKKF